MSATTERDLASRVAKNDFKKGLKLARKVSEAWFRCQALATVARYAPDNDVVVVAKEALTVAQSGKDTYQMVAVTAWPLRALIERGHGNMAEKEVTTLLNLAERIENPISRANAVLLLWQAFFPLQGKAKDAILNSLVHTCTTTHHGKKDSMLRDIVLTVASENPQKASVIAAQMTEGRIKRQIQRRLEAGETFLPREFF